MDFFHHRYCRINKTLVSIFGIWPYQTPCVGLCLQLFISAVTVTYALPTLISFVVNQDDKDFLLQSSVALLLMATLCAKYISSRLRLNKELPVLDVGERVTPEGIADLLLCSSAISLLQLLERIRMDWKVWARHREINILHEYADQGRKMTVVYAVMLYSTCVVVTTPSIMPKIIDVLLGNGSKPGGYPFPVDYYYLDMQKYYFYIMPHSLVCVSVGYVVSIALDTMFILCVQHGCGIFAALGHKLERIGTNETGAELGEKMDYEQPNFELAWCIDRHNDAIEYTELVESVYSWCFFVVLGCNTLVLSITGLQIVNHTMESNETATYAIRNMLALVHLYFENYMCQILMDHSISIRYHIYNGKWYSLSLQAQKGLYLMIMRCNAACKLTAGTIYIMSIENFAVVRTIVLSLALQSNRSHVTLTLVAKAKWDQSKCSNWAKDCFTIVKTSLSFLTVLRSM